MFDVLTEYKLKFYAFLNTVLLFLMLIAGNSSLVSAGIFAVVMIVCLWMEKSFKPNKIDIIILLLFVYELILGILGPGKNNGLVPILNQFIFTASYFIVRLSLKERKAGRLFLCSTSVLFVVISLFCIVSFHIFQWQVSSAGFDNLYDLKFLYRPFGQINNVWASFLLAFLLICLLYIQFYGARKKLVVWLFLCAPLVYCLSVSFSRGIYLCLGVILIVMIVSLLVSRRFSKRTRILLALGVVIGLAIVGFLNRKEVIRTVRFTETVSQQRSLEGRASSLSHLVPAVRKNPWFGTGTHNYALAMDKHIFQDDNVGFTTFAPNIVSQLLIEKGLIGTALWVILGIFILISYWKADKQLRQEQLFILFALFVLILRELAFPSLLTTLGLQLLLAILTGIYVSHVHSKQEYVLGKRFKITGTIAVLAIFIACSMLKARYASHQVHIENFRVSLEDEAYEEAEQHLDKSRQTTPTLVYRSLLYKKKYLTTRDRNDLEQSNFYLSEAIRSNSQDVGLTYDLAMTQFMLGEKQQAMAVLENLCKDFPGNSLMHASFGNVLYLENRKEEAVFHFARAIELAPAILETDHWARFIVRDSASVAKIYEYIGNDQKNIANDPIACAKFGKIYYLLGNYNRAEDFLNKAITALPNLQVPWATLWKIGSERGDANAGEYLKKAVLLGFDKDESSVAVRSSVIFDNGLFPVDPELYAHRNMRFRLWYATEWYPELMVF